MTELPTPVEATTLPGLEHLAPTRYGTIISRDSFEKIDFAIRARLGVAYHDEDTSNAGLQNVVVWGGPGEDSSLVLIASES